MDDERFSRLVERCLDREAGAEEVAELQDVLRNEAGARARFWEAVEWYALFRQWGEQEWGRKAAEAERRVVAMPTAPPVRRVKVGAPGRARAGRFPFARWVAGISAAVAAGTLIVIFQPPAPVATVIKVAGVAGSFEEMGAGTRLRPGSLRLDKGAVVIAFDRGARVVLEGPADFEVRSDNSSALLAGRLRAHVPPSAHGFKVETPRFTAVDLGTEFGCELAANGGGELHVFAGKVDLQAGDASVPLELSAHQAVRIEQGLAATISAEPLAFLSEDELARRDRWEDGDLPDAWRTAGRRIDENPAAVLHLDFERPEGGVVPNLVRGPSAGAPAEIFGCQSADGRWPGKNALAFQGGDDRVEFASRGSFESLTLLAWVRVNGLHAGPNPLVMARDSAAGEVSWYIHRDGGLGLEVAGGAGAGRDFLHTQPVIGPQNLGSWIFLACVFDGANGVAIHYLNGVKVGAKYRFARGPFRLTRAEIGNGPFRAIRQPGDPAANLDGRIDEFAVLASALSPDDLVRLYQQGKPGPR